MKCKIVSWNILEGMGSSVVNGVVHPNPQRLSYVKKTLAELKPDVVVLNEALWCVPHNGLFIDYKELLGYRYSSADLYNEHWGNVILSNSPLTEQSVFRIHNRGGLSAKWNGLTVATYHPHPHRYPAHRANDFKQLLADLSGPVVVCGDFNAISPDDRVDEVKLTAAFAEFSSTPAVSLARFTEGGRVIFKALQDMGFSDGIPHSFRRATIPTRLLSESVKSAVRIDHLWLKNAQVHNGGIIETEHTHYASDHLPIFADVEF